MLGLFRQLFRLVIPLFWRYCKRVSSQAFNNKNIEDVFTCIGLTLFLLFIVFLHQVSLQDHAEIVGGFVTTGQTCMELFESAPGDGSLDCCNCFAFFDQDSEGFAVEGVIGFELADR